MRRVLPLTLLCAGASLSTPALAGNICTQEAGDPQLSFPGTSNPDVFGVKTDPTLGYTLYLCSPTDLDISWLTAYAFGDFNHDGFEDLMFGRTSSGAGAIDLFLNDKTGSGTVVLSATLPTGAADAPTAVDALDLNGDGWDDIISANGGDGTFTVMLNDGTGTYTSVKQYPAGSSVTLLAVADVNGDGYPDVITESAEDQSVTVSLNKGDGTFAAPVTYSAGGPVAMLTVADLNGDGHPDIYVSSVVEFGSGYVGQIVPGDGHQKFLNNGDGTFTPSAWQPISSSYTGGSVSISGADVTVSVSNVGQMLGSGGTSVPGITVNSGTVTFPSGTTSGTVTTTSGGKKNQPSTSGKPSGGKAAGGSTATSGSSGGGAMEWLSLMVLGIAGLSRRKRA